MKPAVLILDCGATNVKACIVDNTGKIVSSYSMANQTKADPFYKEGLIWDIDEIWHKLVLCSRKACKQSTGVEIIGVTVTTFGVDGAPMKKEGSLCYPVISWQCNRTQAIERNIQRYFDPSWLYQTTGLQSYHFNTLYKLIWLKENKPEVIGEMDYFVMMPSLIIHRLSGEFVTDTTMAGTSMLTSYKNRDFSPTILNTLGLDRDIFPKLTEPGKIVGKVQSGAATALGIQAGIAVVASGHDTQFAILGSGAGENKPVLSSGTWEILMVRSRSGSLKLSSMQSGITTELDTTPGLVNLGVQWVASGVLEWISRLFYPGLKGSTLYKAMIEEAACIDFGSDGVMMIPELFTGGFSGGKGTFSGFTHESTRGHFYRSALEALSFYCMFGLEKLQKAGHYRTNELICVGGGSKNALWNQIRSNVLDIPVKALDMKETTALGAAMSTFTGLKIYSNNEEALKAVNPCYTIYDPQKEKGPYLDKYRKYCEEVFPNSL